MEKQIWLHSLEINAIQEIEKNVKNGYRSNYYPIPCPLNPKKRVFHVVREGGE